jgi:lipoprotein-anchoring transpeptidase ErfK/SrfK
MKRILLTFLSLIFLSLQMAGAALASAHIEIERSEQIMRVYIEDRLQYIWPVSTGRRGYTTPAGSYRPYSLKRMHYSSKFDDAPMPYSIFYRGGYAIHGTYAINRLGSPASHGCVRLHISNARELFSIVREFGPDQTRIVIFP